MPPLWGMHCMWQNSGSTCGEFPIALRLFWASPPMQKAGSEISWICATLHRVLLKDWPFPDQHHCLARRHCTPGCSVFQQSLVSICAPCHVLLSSWRTFVLRRWYGNTMDYDQDAPRQVLCDWITNSGGGVAAFDFPSKGILQEAVRYTQYDRLRDRNGKASGLLGWWPQKACTFIDNHDTGERLNIKTLDSVMQVGLLHGCLSLSWQTEVLHCTLCTMFWCTRQLLSALTCSHTS